MTGEDTAAVLRGAAAGDAAAWNQLVDRYSGLIWSVARSYRLGEQDAADVLQTTWMRLLEHLDRIEDPARLGAWLATVARNEIHRLHRKGARVTPTDHEAALDAAAGPQPGSDVAALAAERDRLLWEAFAALTDRCQELLRVVVCGTPAGEPMAYRDAAALLGLPVGGIGPTRMRCLAALRAEVADRGISGEPDGS